MIWEGYGGEPSFDSFAKNQVCANGNDRLGKTICKHMTKDQRVMEI